MPIRGDKRAPRPEHCSCRILEESQFVIAVELSVKLCLKIRILSPDPSFDWGVSVCPVDPF